MWSHCAVADMARSPEEELDELQRKAAAKTAAAFRRAAQLVVEERKLRTEAGGPPHIWTSQIFPEVADFVIDPKSEAVSRAMDLLKPTKFPKDRSREIIADAMYSTLVFSFENRSPSLGDIKSRIDEVANKLNDVKQAISNLPAVARAAQSVYRSELCNLIDEVLRTVEQHRDGLKLGRGGWTLDLSKQCAASGAGAAPAGFPCRRSLTDDCISRPMKLKPGWPHSRTLRENQPLKNYCLRRVALCPVSISPR
jgi:hypothetical protein